MLFNETDLEHKFRAIVRGCFLPVEVVLTKLPFGLCETNEIFSFCTVIVGDESFFGMCLNYLTFV